MGSFGEEALPGPMGSSAGRRDPLGAAGAGASGGPAPLVLTYYQPWAFLWAQLSDVIIFYFESDT